MRANWKRIKKDKRGQWAALYVTLNRKGELRLSRSVFERMGQPKAVHVLFDEANNRIGLQPISSPAVTDAFVVSASGAYGGRVVRVYRLLAEAGIILPQTIQFVDAEVDHQGILILNLRTAIVPARVKNWRLSRRQSDNAATDNRSADAG
jgi:hypothetical protein